MGLPNLPTSSYFIGAAVDIDSSPDIGFVVQKSMGESIISLGYDQGVGVSSRESFKDFSGPSTDNTLSVASFSVTKSYSSPTDANNQKDCNSIFFSGLGLNINPFFSIGQFDTETIVISASEGVIEDKPPLEKQQKTESSSIEGKLPIKSKNGDKKRK